MGKTWRVTADRNGSDGICKLETVDFVASVVEEKGQSPNQRCCPAVFWGRRSLGLFPQGTPPLAQLSLGNLWVERCHHQRELLRTSSDMASVWQ